jgi:hypothetical protein
VESSIELLTGSKFFTTSVDTLVIINIVLPAMLGLVGVGETSIERSSCQLLISSKVRHGLMKLKEKKDVAKKKK